MTSRLRRFLGLSALAATMSCESGTDPEVQNLIDLTLDFCSNDVPVWIAYRNQGDNWTRLTPNAEGTVSFTGTNDVALAFVHQNGTDYSTEFVFAANHELEEISGLTCREESGPLTVNGSVAGVVGSQLALAGMSYSSVYLQSSQSSFSLTNLPSRALDVVASRINVAATTQNADRMIIRRSQSLLNNATMPVLDFNAAEAFQPTAFGITVSGVGAGENAFLANYFVSQLETSHIVSYTEPVGNGSHTAYGVPATQLAAGDYHDAFVVVVDAAGATRGMERYFRTPGVQTLTAGAPMSVPTIAEAAATPYLRLRANLARDADYARAIRVSYVQQQGQFSSTGVSLTVTANYDGAGEWQITIPDMTGVDGWQHSWGLTPDADDVDWTVTAYGGRPELLFGATPNDGEAVRFASRTDLTASATAPALRGAATAARLPRLFSPSR